MVVGVLALLAAQTVNSLTSVGNIHTYIYVYELVGLNGVHVTWI